MPRIVHFEISADNPDRAIAFYKNTFDWKFEKWGEQDYWMVTTGDSSQPGIDGGLSRRDKTFTAITNIVDVPQIEEFAAKIIAAGGIQIIPKAAIPGVGYVAYFKDTEGNIFGIYQEDKTAK